MLPRFAAMDEDALDTAGDHEISGDEFPENPLPCFPKIGSRKRDADDLPPGWGSFFEAGFDQLFELSGKRFQPEHVHLGMALFPVEKAPGIADRFPRFRPEKNEKPVTILRNCDGQKAFFDHHLV